MMDLAQIIARFDFPGSLVEAVPFGRGHINDTYAVSLRQPDGSQRRYILQKINQYVFKDPMAVMENVERVTRHLHAKIQAAGGDPLRETLNLVPARDGRVLFIATRRVMSGARSCLSKAPAPTKQPKARSTFTRPPGHLVNFQPNWPIFRPGCCTKPSRTSTTPRAASATFEEAVQRDATRRAAAVRDEIRFLEQREADTRVLTDLIDQGRLPLRVTHNDTKFNNVMIDDHSGAGRLHRGPGYGHAGAGAVRFWRCGAQRRRAGGRR